MIVEKYLHDLLEGAGEYALTSQDIEIIERKGIQDFVLAKLFSKKFRKWRIDEKCKALVEKEVDLALEEDRPIKVFFAQGSYKLWRVKSSPRSNWAEFFNLFYLISYLAPVASAYKQGVELTYYFLRVLPLMHNNLRQEDVSEYYESFKELMDKFRQYLPPNIVIKIERDIDGYSREKYDSILSSAMVDAKTDFYKWPKEKQDDYLRRAHLNIKWDGLENWMTLPEDEKQKKVEQAVLYEYAATQVILEKDKENRGVILSTLPREDSIGVGSTSTSIAKHWVGEGVLEENNGMFYPRILSPSQYEYAKTLEHQTHEVKLLPGEVFSKIDVFSKHFDFSQK